MQSAQPILGSFKLRFSSWFLGPLLYMHALPNRDVHTSAGHFHHMGFVHCFLRLFHRRGCDSRQWYDLRTRGNRSTLLVSWRCILGQPPHEVVRFQFVIKRSFCSNLKGTSTQAPMPTDLLRVRVLRRLGGAILDFV